MSDNPSIWRAQDILGLSDSQYYCNDHSPELINERNYRPDNSSTEFTGEEFGTSKYDKKNK